MDKTIASFSQTLCLVGKKKKKDKKKLAVISNIPRESYKSGFPNDIVQHFPFILSDPKNPVGSSALKSAQTKMQVFQAGCAPWQGVETR